MRKGLRRKQQRQYAPIMVTRLLNPTLEVKERVAVNAFTMGAATKLHFDTLLDMMNMLLIGGSSDDSRKYALDYADKTIRPVLTRIRDRYEKTGKLGVTAIEKQTLIEMVDFSEQFWIRQPADLYLVAAQELKKYYESLEHRQ